MKYFIYGLVTGFCGFIIWVISSIVAGMSESFSVSQPWFGRPLMYPGFILMLFGPLVFWLILPVAHLLRKKR